MKRSAALAAVLVLAGCAHAAQDVSWPELPAPPRSTVQWVAEHMQFNGMPMQIRTFRAQASAADVLSYYRARWWKGTRCDCVENGVGAYRQIARGEGRYFYSVQVKALDARTSEGYLAVSVPAAPAAKPGAGFPQPPATRVMNDIRADDGDTASRTLLMENRHAVAVNVAFYERELERLGWHAAGQLPAAGPASALRFRRANGEITLVFKQSGRRTVAAATVVEHRFAGAADARTGLR